MTRGKMIVIEGKDGVGKTTTVKELKQLFVCENLPVLDFRYPNGLFRDIACAGGDYKDFAALAAINAANQMLDYRKLIEPALKLGTHVICDRWWPSTVVYQGAMAAMISEESRRIFYEAYRNFFFRLFPELFNAPDFYIELRCDNPVFADKLAFYESQGDDFKKKLDEGYDEIFSDPKWLDSERTYLFKTLHVNSPQIATLIFKHVQF